MIRPLALLLPAALAACVGADFEETGQIEQGVTACYSEGPTVEGVDVSEFQGTIDWNAVHASGRQFAITRISDGTGHHDPTFARNWAGIRAAGMLRGAYMFFEAGESPTAQADLVISSIGRLGDGDLPFLADVESNSGASHATIVANLHTFLDRVQAGTGKVPMIYTGAWWWDGGGYLGGATGFSQYPLDFSGYSSCGTAPREWTSYVMWQYSDGSCPSCPAACSRIPGFSNVNSRACGGAPGTSVDRDRWRGTLAQLQAFAGGGVDWGAQYVMQSFPLAADPPLEMTAGSTAPAWIELRNTGTRAWDHDTRLATTGPRDRNDPFAGADWISPSRPVSVPAGTTVAPGATYRFQWTLHAPAVNGLYDLHFGVEEEGVAWFGDPDQGGPPDDQLEARIVVTGGVDARDAGREDAATDGGTPDTGPARDGGVDGAVGDHESDGMPPGCACSTTSNGRAGAMPFGAWAALATVLVARRRTRR